MTTYIKLVVERVVKLKFLVHFLCSKRHPFINSQSSILPWIILGEQGLKLSLKTHQINTCLIWTLLYIPQKVQSNCVS